jgi:hypothetical protein
MNFLVHLSIFFSSYFTIFYNRIVLFSHFFLLHNHYVKIFSLIDIIVIKFYNLPFQNAFYYT